jgi:hypothetical protein
MSKTTAHPGLRRRVRLWFVMLTVSSEWTMNIGPVLLSDRETGYVTRIGDDAR